MSAPGHPSRRIAEKLLVVSLGFLAFLLATELSLWLASLVYFEPQGRPGYDISEHLTADDLVCEACPVIVCVGDSFTYGIGASEGRSYPDQLAGQLGQALGQPVAVLNGGIGGANSSQVYSRLAQYGRVIEPDVVVLLAGARNKENLAGFSLEPRSSEEEPSEPPRRGLLGRLRLVRLLRFGLAGLRQASHQAWEERLAEEIGGLSDVDVYLRWRARTGRDRGQDPADRSFEQGASLLELGRYRAAREHFARGIEQDPGDSANYWGLGFASRGERELQAAVDWFERGIQADPSDPVNYLGVGMVAMDDGAFWELGARRMAEALEVDPDFAEAFCHYAHFVDSPREALDWTLRGIERDPDAALCYDNLMNQVGHADAQGEIEARLEALAPRSVIAQAYLNALRAGALDDSWTGESELHRWLERDLRDIIAYCAQRDIPLIVQNYPWPDLVSPTIERVARDAGVVFVDQERHFEALLAGGTPREALFVRDGHCNDRGYGQMAEQILLALRRHGLIPGLSPDPAPTEVGGMGSEPEPSGMPGR
jgi:tetratricopeptide (TPR) repeat protein